MQKSDLQKRLEQISDTHTTPQLVQAVEKMIDEAAENGRLTERKVIALDNYLGHTFSDATNWQGKFEKFMENNERRIKQMEDKSR